MMAFAVLLAGCSVQSDKNANVDKLTYHNNPQRTGWNPQEIRLTPAKVASPEFGLLWQTPALDSFAGMPPRFFATPLYVDQASISAGRYQGRVLSALYVVSTTGFAYAVNAFAMGDAPAGAVLWRTRLTAKPCYEGTLGNLSTPVIDLAKHTLYVTSCDEDAHWQVHALDIRSGEELSGWPVNVDHVAINAPGVNRNGSTRFPEHLIGIQRGALNLSPNGSRLYVAFAGDGLGGIGWLVAVDTLRAKVATAFSATAVTDEAQGGMWASGGPAVDSDGRVHIATGASFTLTTAGAGLAGVFADSPHNWGQSIIQLKDSAVSGFELTGTYTPFNYCQAQAADIDLGSSGTVVIDLDPATTSTPHVLALGGAKQGSVYLLDRTQLPGGVTQRHGCSDDPASDLSLLAPHAQPEFGKRGPLHVFGPYTDTKAMLDQARSRTTLAHFRDAQGNNYLFVTGSSKRGEFLTDSAPPGLVKVAIVTAPGQPAYLKIDRREETQTFINPGSPVVTSHGGKDAIVWVLDANAPRSAPLYGADAPKPVLYAFDAATLKLLWKSVAGELPTSGKYNEPTIVKGTVFVATDRVHAYGLRAAKTAAKAAEFRPLFDGKTLEHWRGDPALWSVVDGAITGKTDGKMARNSFLIHDEAFSNFELRFKYRFTTEKGNSGMQFRSRVNPEQEFGMIGYQANVVTPDAKERFAMLWEEDARNLLAYLGEKAEITNGQGGMERKVFGMLNSPEEILAAVKPYPQWNDFTVIAYENRLVQVVNGAVTVDVLDNDVGGRALQGVFGLQLHAGPPMDVQFKDIEVKRLNAAPDLTGRFRAQAVEASPVMDARMQYAGSAEKGKTVYEARCVMCHGSGQQGIPTRAHLATLSTEKILNTLTYGAMATQAFGLNDMDRKDVAAFLTAAQNGNK